MEFKKKTKKNTRKLVTKSSEKVVAVILNFSLITKKLDFINEF